MDVETTYKFEGDAKVSEVANFLREKHETSGWRAKVEPTAVGGYSAAGKLRIDLVESHDEPGGD